MYCVETCYSKVPSTEGFFKELFCNVDKHCMIYELGKFRHFLKWDIPLALLQRKRWFLLIIRPGGKMSALPSVSYSHFKGAWEKQRTQTFCFVKARNPKGCLLCLLSLSLRGNDGAIFPNKCS